jgi:hypothetical protein
MSGLATPRPPRSFGAFQSLRRDCARAGVPLVDAARWHLPDREVTAATLAARTGPHLPSGVDALEALVDAGAVQLASPAPAGGPPSRSELVVLVSILRSRAADSAAIS